MAKMKCNRVFRLLVSLTVVVLCMAAFSVIAFAGGGALVLILLLTALGGGGAFAYIKFIKPKQGAKVSTDTDNYEFEDEGYEDGTIQFFIISDSTISISSSVLLAERSPDTHKWTNWAIASMIW